MDINKKEKMLNTSPTKCFDYILGDVYLLAGNLENPMASIEEVIGSLYSVAEDISECKSIHPNYKFDLYYYFKHCHVVYESPVALSEIFKSAVINCADEIIGATQDIELIEVS